MSGYRGPGGRRGPDYGPGDGSGGTPASSSGVGGSSLPVWAVVLIVVGLGLMTLVWVWLCVVCVCRKRRARRAAVRDLEVQSPERATARMMRDEDAKEVENQAKPCEADVGVEMTFVVMAGEDQPSYLACPTAPVLPTVPEEFEKSRERQPAASCPPHDGLLNSPTDLPLPESHLKNPPSPT